MINDDLMPTKDTKLRIKHAAMDLFKDRGFDNVTIDEICLCVGITKPAFYYHYKSKQNIFDSFYAEVIDKTNKKMAAMFSMSAYWHRIWTILELFLDHTESAGYDIMTQILKYSLDGRNDIFKEYFDSISSAEIALIDKALVRSEMCSTLPAERLYKIGQEIIMGTLVLWCSERGAFSLKYTVRESLEDLFDLKQPLRLNYEEDRFQ